MISLFIVRPWAWFEISLSRSSNVCLVKYAGFDMSRMTLFHCSWKWAGSMLTTSRLSAAYDRGYPAVSRSVCAREDQAWTKLGMREMELQNMRDSCLCVSRAYCRLPPPYCWRSSWRASLAVRLVPVEGSWIDGIMPRISRERRKVIMPKAIALHQYQVCHSRTCACMYPGGRVGGYEGALRTVHGTLAAGGLQMWLRSPQAMRTFSMP